MSLHEEKHDDLRAMADAAFQCAAAKVVERARQTGTPIIIWKDGGVVELSCVEAEKLIAARQSSNGHKKPV